MAHALARTLRSPSLIPGTAHLLILLQRAQPNAAFPSRQARLTRRAASFYMRDIMELDLGIALLFFLVGGGFVFVNLTLGKYFRPDNPYDDKNEIYECGERPI